LEKFRRHVEEAERASEALKQYGQPIASVPGLDAAALRERLATVKEVLDKAKADRTVAREQERDNCQMIRNAFLAAGLPDPWSVTVAEAGSALRRLAGGE